MSSVQSGLSAKQGIFCINSTSQIPYELGLMYNLVRALMPLPHDAVHGLHSLLHSTMDRDWIIFGVHGGRRKFRGNGKNNMKCERKEMKDEI